MYKYSFIVLMTAAVFGAPFAIAATPSTGPVAGITPSSPLYIFDRLAERIQEMFTFNPEAKAKLQLTFSEERVAEIGKMAEQDRPDVKGMVVAQNALIANVQTASQIVKQEKNAGKDVTALARNLDTSFAQQEQLLTATYKKAYNKLRADRVKTQQNLLGTSATTTNAPAVVVVPQDTAVKDIEAQMKLLDQQMNDMSQISDSQKPLDAALSPTDLAAKHEREAKKGSDTNETSDKIEKVEPQEKPEQERGDSKGGEDASSRGGDSRIGGEGSGDRRGEGSRGEGGEGSRTGGERGARSGGEGE